MATYYPTETKCQKCGTAERYVSTGHCVECCRLRKRGTCALITKGRKVRQKQAKKMLQKMQGQQGEG